MDDYYSGYLDPIAKIWANIPGMPSKPADPAHKKIPFLGYQKVGQDTCIKKSTASCCKLKAKKPFSG
jgi:hypothetical protein